MKFSIGDKVLVKTSSHSDIQPGDIGTIFSKEKGGFGIEFKKIFKIPVYKIPDKELSRIIFCPINTLQLCK